MYMGKTYTFLGYEGTHHFMGVGTTFHQYLQDTLMISFGQSSDRDTGLNQILGFATFSTGNHRNKVFFQS